MPSDGPGDWIPRYFEFWNRHAHDEIAAFFAEDALYDDVGLAQSWRGRDAIRECSVFSETGFSSDYGARLLRYTQGGNVWVAEWEFHGTHDRGTEPYPPSGKPFVVRILTVGEVNAEGKITLKRDYFDPRVTRKLLGLREDETVQSA